MRRGRHRAECQLPKKCAELKNFDDLRRLRARRGRFNFYNCAAPVLHVLAARSGRDYFEEIDCFDAIEFCHFHIGLFNPNRRAKRVASRFGKPLIATSDAHRLHAFGRHYTSIPDALCADRRKCFRGLAQWAASPNESCVQFRRSCQRDLFCFPCASISSAPEDRRFQEAIYEWYLNRLLAEADSGVRS